MRRSGDLDAKDRAILALLETDARRSNSDIGRLTSLSAPTVAERIARLRDIGVIQGFTVRIDPGRVGLPVSAIVEFQPHAVGVAEAVEVATRHPGVRDCFRVTGTALLVLMVRVTDNDGLKSLLLDLSRLGETKTSVILSTDFQGRPIFADSASAAQP